MNGAALDRLAAVPHAQGHIQNVVDLLNGDGYFAVVLKGAVSGKLVSLLFGIILVRCLDLALVDQSLRIRFGRSGSPLVKFIRSVQKVCLVPLQSRNHPFRKIAVGLESPLAPGSIAGIRSAHVHVHCDFSNAHPHSLYSRVPRPLAKYAVGRHGARPRQLGNSPIQQGAALHGKRVQRVERCVAGDVLGCRLWVRQHIQNLDGLDLSAKVGGCGVCAHGAGGSVGELLELVKCQRIQRTFRDGAERLALLAGYAVQNPSRLSNIQNNVLHGGGVPGLDRFNVRIPFYDLSEGFGLFRVRQIGAFQIAPCVQLGSLTAVIIFPAPLGVCLNTLAGGGFVFPHDFKEVDILIVRDFHIVGFSL